MNRRAPSPTFAIAMMLLMAACSSGAAPHDARPAGTVTATTAAARAARAARSAGCAAHAPVKPGIADHTIRSGGVERTYQLDVPASYDGKTAFPVVLALHALTEPYWHAPATAEFPKMARTYEFVGVAPSGRLDGSTPYWVAAPTTENRDVDFIADLLAKLEATMCIDARRVYSTGLSNGAQMSSLLACRLSDRITAIGPVSGEEYLAPCRGRPVPIMAFHGTADRVLPYTGGGLNATQIADTYFWKGNVPKGMPKPLGIDASMRLWAEHNGCRPEFAETIVSPHVRKREWRGCAADTVLYVVEGGGHGWPGNPVPAFEAQFGPDTTEIDAGPLLWSFFFRHVAN